MALLLLSACGVDATAPAEEASSATPATIAGPQALMADHADCFDGDPGCLPTGAHQKHDRYSCSVCHKVAGRLVFDSTSTAYNPSLPRPTFNAVDKTCSNVGCHSIPAGTFSYWMQGGDGEPVQNTVAYGGPSGGVSPSWYATGSATCSACHSIPARLADGTIPAWHSGRHAFPFTPNGNACQLCHPGVTGAYVSGGYPSFVNTSGGLVTSCAPYTYCTGVLTSTVPSLHGNGVIDVSPAFKSACFGCH